MNPNTPICMPYPARTGPCQKSVTSLTRRSAWVGIASDRSASAFQAATGMLVLVQ